MRAGVLCCAVAAMLALGSRVDAQDGILLYAPAGAANTTLFTSSAGGALTSNGTIDIGVGVGGAASSATMRGDQAYVYVSNEPSNTLRVINTATLAIVQTVTTVSATPGSGAFSPDGTKFYLPNTTSTTVSIYSVNAATGQLTAAGTIAGAGTKPRAAAVNADGTRLYVADQGSSGSNGSFRVIDTATNTVIAALATGGQLNSIALSADGSRAYMTDIASNVVRVIDTSSATQVAAAATGNSPRDVVVSKDGKYFYVSNNNSFTIQQYSTATNTAIGAAVASGSNPIGLAISPDGKTLYVGLGGTDDSIRAFSIDSATGGLTQIGNFAATDDVNRVTVCSGGGALLGRGGTFFARTAGALGCAAGATGSVSFTGGTLMSGANGLTFSTPATLGSGGGTIDTNGNTTTYAGAITGSGGLTKTGDGTLILTGTNSYSGGTTILQGTLQGNAASLPGNILNNAALVLDQTGSGTMTGVISGSGTITKQGAGLLVLNGNSRAFAGTTTVNAGNLQIGDANNPGAALGGNVTVNSGATLSGHGSVVGSVSNPTGTVSPGGSIGTLSITGNYVQGAAGTLSIEISATEASKLVVSGSAQLAGTLVLVPTAGAGPGTRFQVLTAGGGITGSFTTITGLGPLVELVPFYSAGGIDLQVRLADLRPFAATENQRRGAAGIVAAANTTVATSLVPALAAVGNLSTAAQVRSAIDALAGAAEGYTGLATATARTAETLSSTVGRQIFQTHARLGEAQAAMGGRAAAVQLASLDPVAQLAGGSAAEAPSPWSAWASGFGVFGGVAGNANSHDLSYSTGGSLFGADYRLDPALLVGGFAGYGGTGTGTAGLSGSGTVNSYAVGTYASWTPQGRGRGTYVDGMLGYAYNDSQLRRSVSFPGFPATGVTGTTDAHQFLSFVEVGRGYGMVPALTAVPFVNLNLTTFRQDGLTETGAVGLVVAPRTTSTLGSVLGARLEHAVDLGEGRTLNAGIKVGWAHAIADSDRRVTARFAGAAGSTFTLEGAMPRSDSAVLGAGVDARLDPRTSLYLHFDTAINGRDDAHALIGGLRLTW